MKKLFWVIVVTILIVLASGYLSKWYGESIGCTKCQVGIPNFLTIADMNECLVCWMPSYCPIGGSEETGEV